MEMSHWFSPSEASVFRWILRCNVLVRKFSISCLLAISLILGKAQLARLLKTFSFPPKKDFCCVPTGFCGQFAQLFRVVFTEVRPLRPNRSFRQWQ